MIDSFAFKLFILIFSLKFSQIKQFIWVYLFFSNVVFYNDFYQYERHQFLSIKLI